MPELPEVETVCRGLAENIVGKKITSVLARRRNLRVPLPENFAKALTNRKVTGITRRAKYILIHLDNEQICVVHLGMSGSLVLHDSPPESFRKHDHVIMEFTPYKLMVFHDPRRFGLMSLTTQKTIKSDKIFSGLGGEPLDDAMDAPRFYALLQSSKAPVKSVIMDQSKIVGVGNIYACEALFKAGIHPARPANQVTRKEAGLLIRSIKKVLQEAIKSGGSTLRDYVRSSGEMGYFQHHFNVYGHAKQPCPACKTPISTLRQSGRSTFFCKNCQR